MSSNHPTLQAYLANRKGQDRKHSFRPLHGKSQAIGSTQIHGTVAQQIYISQRQPWQTNFHDSKRQCLNELRRIRQKLSNQQYYIVRYLESYENSVYAAMEEEFQKIKQELNRLLDISFEENRRRVRECFHTQGGAELAELDQIRQKLNQIKRQIEEYEQALEGNGYKKGVAAVVLTDFEGEGEALLAKIATALMRYEDKVFLRVDTVKFNRIREDVATLITYGDFDRARGNPIIERYGSPSGFEGGNNMVSQLGQQGSSLNNPTLLKQTVQMASHALQNPINQNLHKNRDLLQRSAFP